MKRRFATTLAAIAFVATVGWNMTATGSGHEPERMALEKVGVMHIADGDATSSVSANAKHDSIFAPNEVGSILKGDDLESLRLKLLVCLLIMLIAPLGGLVAICYIDHRTALRDAQAPNTSPALGVPMNMEMP